MDRHGPSPPYPYGYPPPNQAYPPYHLPPNSDVNPYPNPPYNQPYPHLPPPNSDGNAPPPYPNPHAPYPYPYAAPAPYAYPYLQANNPYPCPFAQPTYPSPPHPHSYAGPPPPQSITPPSTLQQSNNFHQYGSPNYQQDDKVMHRTPQPRPRTNSSSGNPGHDYASSGLPYNVENKSENRLSNASPHPPLDNLMADMHLSENRPSSAPASPSSPAMPMAGSLPLADQGAKGDLSRGGHSRNSTWDSSLTETAPKGVLNRSLCGQHSRTPTWDCVSTPKADSAGSPSSPKPNNLQLVPCQKGSSKILLLHGNLDIWIYEAKSLPNLDMFSKFLAKSEGQAKNTSDPYVNVTVANAVIARTFVIVNDENPVWMQHFNVPVAHHASDIHFLVKDSDIVGSQLIGNISIPVETIYSGTRVEGIYPILNTSGKQCKAGAVLSLRIQYTPMKNLSIYHNGVGAGPDYPGVPGTYFPLRKGGAVTLYQDAHVHDGRLPEFTLEWGKRYVHGKCWEVVFDAIRQARRLIYITGWSVWHKVALVRDAYSGASETTLGDLLRSKSAEGVRVLLLIWDDPTSRSILGYKTDGIMATHDEETRRFFKHSSVQVLLCPRAAAKRHSWVKQREVSTIYTHHQKTVIVDADAGNYRRKIIAFVGGLDLCDGRYDTPDHHIFRTLDTVHKDDYHNPCYQGNTTGCPREPWHDLHCKIDGPAAYDVLTNFEERWLKASKPHGIKKLKASDDALLKIERLPDILGIHEAPCLSEDDQESWHVQVFRSIDSSSVKGFPKNPKEATSKNLVCGKNVLIDMSIHTAYVKAIRAAQHFIYIENQYFIGSSFNWSAHKDLGADNLIPMEIALKICEKIRAHERFAAYIVIPMWPEGIPTSSATQRILYWQNKTMQMMYEMVYKALVEVGLEEAYTPQDYLNFFCLGNREAPHGSPAPAGTNAPQPNTPQALSQKYRRFMIYVHSKGMIVDDEYVILGSANINQRSMEGTRDTEIAMGAYQPQYTWARKSASPCGQIYGYRMSLWTEHLGFVDECFTQPARLECVRKVKAWSEMNWRQFIDETPTEMTGHLLKYPVDVDRRGKVKPLPGCVTFPDLGGDICGSFLGIQENLTI